MNFSDRQILFEDNHIIVINKKPGQLVQGDHTGDEPLSESLKKYLKDKYNKPGNVYVAVVHRLDRPTSGIVVFAKTSKAAARLSKMFQEKKLEKTYWALVENKPPKPSDTLVHFLKKNAKQNKSYAINQAKEGYKKAILHYKTIGKGDKYSLLEVQLETGRHHQIRTQLSTINCRLKGDLKYGAKRSNPDGSIGLHSRQLSFIHPVSKEPVKFIAPAPEGIWGKMK